MYLVLTALLALNVSTSVLDAFKIIDEALEKTGVTINANNDEIYGEFSKAMILNETKTKPWHDKAVEVKQRTQELYDHIQDLKIRTLSQAEGKKSEAIEGNVILRDKITATTDYDTPHNVMIGKGIKGSEAEKLKERIAELREYFLNINNGEPLPEPLVESVTKSLNTDPPEHEKKTRNPEERTWEYHKFGHSPLMGFLAIMSSFQIDIRNAESEMINYLYAQISAGEVKFNELEAVVIPNSNYIIKGNQYRAEVFLAARDTTQAPVIYAVPGVKEPWVETVDEDGQVKYEIREGLNPITLEVEKGAGKGIYTTGGAIGSHSWGGIIEIQTDAGPLRRPFSAEYTVAEGSAVVSATKMNVFYLGVENPVEISVSGIAGNKIRATASNGILDKEGNSYIMRPKRQGNCIISVSAEIDGNWTTVGTKDFRVKTVPDPYATVNDQRGGAIAKNVLMAQSGVIATMPEDFEFEYPIKVTEYSVVTLVQGFVREQKVKGAAFTQDVRNLINSLNRGNTVYIQDIKAVGVDGSVKDLPTITFKLN